MEGINSSAASGGTGEEGESDLRAGQTEDYQ